MMGAVVENQVAVSDTMDTPSTEAGPSPRPTPIDMSSSQKGSYQATVEDHPEDVDEGGELGSRTQDSARGSLSNTASTESPASSVVSESASSKVSAVSSRRPSAPMSASPESPCPSPKTRPTVRFSDRGPVVLHGRPKLMPPRVEVTEMDASSAGLSAVDVKWGRLFDDNGAPTARFGQLLRGIANYLV